jgi:hypothetical protein
MAIAVTGGIAAERLLGTRETERPSEREWIARYVVEEPGVHLATFPTAIINGIAPPAPAVLPNFAVAARQAAGAGRRGVTVLEDLDAPGTRAEPEAQPASAHDGGEERAPVGRLSGRLARLSLQPSHRVRSLRNLAGIVLLAALVWASRRSEAGSTLWSLARASLAIVGFNWVFHGFWGGETFLYSQHWHVPLTILVAGLVAVPRTHQRVATALLLFSVAAVAVSNLIVLSRALSSLGGG